MASSSTRTLKKITKKNQRVKKLKETVKKVVNYLKSDTHMYSPLLSYGPSHGSSPQNAIVSATEGTVGTKKLDKKFVSKVWDYLKSDCHMYAPIASSTYGQEMQCHKEATAPAPQDIRVLKTNQPFKRAGKRQVRKRSSPRTKVIQQAVAYKQAAKQMATLNCISSPESGESVEKRRKVSTNSEEEELMKFINSGRRK